MLKSPAWRPLSTLPRAPFASPLLRRRFVRPISHVAIQHVRLKRRFFTWRRFLSFAIYTGAAYFWLSVILGPVLNDIEGQGQGQGQGEGEGEGEGEDEDFFDDDALFIPLTWAKPRPREFYKASSPEWQEFRKVAKDQKAIKRMQEKLVAICRKFVANDTNAAKRIGRIDVTKGRWWLDITFPDGPPIEYERYGIEIGDEYIALGKRTISQVNHSREKRALWPTAVASSVYAVAEYLFKSNVNRVREMLGLAPWYPKVEMIEKHFAAIQRAQKMSSTQQNGVGHASATAPRATSASPQAAANQATSQERDASDITPHTIALAMGVANLKQKWQISLNCSECPRGTIGVSGLVEILGEKGRLTMDVSAAYDPRTEDYVSVHGHVRRMMQKRQVPRGGA